MAGSRDGFETRSSKTCGGANPEDAEYFVPIRWLQTVTLDRAVRDIGLFGNQSTVCKPTTPKGDQPSTFQAALSKLRSGLNRSPLPLED